MKQYRDAYAAETRRICGGIATRPRRNDNRLYLQPSFFLRFCFTNFAYA